MRWKQQRRENLRMKPAVEGGLLCCDATPPAPPSSPAGRAMPAPPRNLPDKIEQVSDYLQGIALKKRTKKTVLDNIRLIL